MTRRPHWPRLVEPIEQRIRGWRAYVQGDKADAIYHFKRCVTDLHSKIPDLSLRRSLLAAEVVEGLEEQAAHTLSLMHRLNAMESGSQEDV